MGFLTFKYQWEKIKYDNSLIQSQGDSISRYGFTCARPEIDPSTYGMVGYTSSDMSTTRPEH